MHFWTNNRFEKAATKLQVARFDDDAIALLDRAASCHLQENYQTQARACFERSANLALKKKNGNQAAHYFVKVHGELGIFGRGPINVTQ